MKMCMLEHDYQIIVEADFAKLSQYLSYGQM